MDRNIHLLSVLVVIFTSALLNCASTAPEMAKGGGQPAQPPPAPTPPDTVVFDPLELGDDSIFVPRQPESLFPGAKPAPTTAVTPAETDTVQDWSEQAVQGYRVQIFASSNVDQARGAEQLALTHFPEGVYLIYDPPNYKVRVGNCLTRKEAQELTQRAHSLGYRDAWVVKDNIVVKVKEGQE